MTTEQFWGLVLCIYLGLNGSYLFVQVVLEEKRIRLIPLAEVSVADIVSAVFLIPAFIVYGVIYGSYLVFAWVWEKLKISSLLKWKPFAPKHLLEVDTSNLEWASEAYSFSQEPSPFIRTNYLNRILRIEEECYGGVYARNALGKLEWVTHGDYEFVTSGEMP